LSFGVFLRGGGLGVGVGGARVGGLRLVVALSVLWLAAGAALADPRTPISSIPFTITQPGSYYLTGNLTSPGLPAGGITINTSHVTLDLMGFVISGSRTPSAGIFVTAPNTDVAIRNGTIRNWIGIGVDASGASVILEDLRAVDNRGDGIRAGSASQVRGCTATGNGAVGIIADEDSVVIHCLAANNTDNGIIVDRGTINSSTASKNGGNGIWAQYTTVSQNAANGNANDVIACDSGCTVVENVVAENHRWGLNVHNSAYANNTLFNNALPNPGSGVQTGGNVCNISLCP